MGIPEQGQSDAQDSGELGCSRGCWLVGLLGRELGGLCWALVAVWVGL